MKSFSGKVCGVEGGVTCGKDSKIIYFRVGRQWSKKALEATEE